GRAGQHLEVGLDALHELRAALDRDAREAVGDLDGDGRLHTVVGVADLPVGGVRPRAALGGVVAAAGVRHVVAAAAEERVAAVASGEVVAAAAADQGEGDATAPRHGDRVVAVAAADHDLLALRDLVGDAVHRHGLHTGDRVDRDGDGVVATGAVHDDA